MLKGNAIIVLVFVIIIFLPSHHANGLDAAIEFNKFTVITQSEITDILNSFSDAITDKDTEGLRKLMDEFHPLEIGNVFWADNSHSGFETLILDKYFSHDDMNAIRHYCFGAGAEDVPWTSWKLLSVAQSLEEREIHFYDYPPHPDDFENLIGLLIVFPDTKYLDFSLIFGVDACLRLWLVADYMHGSFQGIQIYLCHSIETEEWFIRYIEI